MDFSGTKINAEYIKSKLAEKYSTDKGYLFFSEVSTYGLKEGNSNRRVDGVIVSMFPSNGLHKMGVEIKISRSDLSHELSDFSKSQAMFNYFEYFYLAVPHKKIVEGFQIPDHWGIMIVNETTNRIVRPAKLNEHAVCDNSFLSRICQKVTTEFISRETHNLVLNQYQERINELDKKVRFTEDRNYERLQRDLNDMRKKYVDLQEKTGIRLEWMNDTEAQSLAAAMAMVKQQKYHQFSKDIHNQIERLKVLEELSQKIEAFQTTE